MSTIKVKYRSVYNRRKSLDRNGKASVVIEAYQNGQCKYFETGIRLIPIEWDERKSEVKKQPGLNRLIRERILELETFELSFSANYARAFELSDFSRLNTEGNEKENKAVSFPEFALEQIDRDYADKSVNVITYGLYKRVIRLMAEFAKTTKVEFLDLTYSFVNRFDYHLKTVDKLNVNTIYKHHQVIQKYLTVAIKKGLFETRKNLYNDFHEVVLKIRARNSINFVSNGQVVNTQRINSVCRPPVSHPHQSLRQNCSYQAKHARRIDSWCARR